MALYACSGHPKFIHLVSIAIKLNEKNVMPKILGQIDVLLLV